MKQRLLLFVFLFSFFTNTSAFAEPCNSFSDQISSNFVLTEVDINEDGYLLLSGYDEVAGASSATLMFCDMKENVLWSTKWKTAKTDEPLQMYSDGKFWIDDTIIAMRSNSLEDYSQAIECFQNGKRIGVIEVGAEAHRLIPLKDGFLVSTTPTEISKYSPSGRPLWNLHWEEPISIMGVVSNLDQTIHIAYGFSTSGNINSDFSSVGHLICFNNDGMLLWSQNYPEIWEFTDAVWGENNDVILIGKLSYWEGFIAKYNGAEKKWLSSYPYFVINDGKKEERDGRLVGLVRTEEGFYTVAEFSEDEGVSILYFDNEGILVKEWVESIDYWGRANHISLFAYEDELFLLLNGKTQPTEYTKSGTPKNFAELPNMTILKKVSIP